MNKIGVAAGVLVLLLAMIPLTYVTAGHYHHDSGRAWGAGLGGFAAGTIFGSTVASSREPQTQVIYVQQPPTQVSIDNSEATTVIKGKAKKVKKPVIEEVEEYEEDLSETESAE